MLGQVMICWRLLTQFRVTEDTPFSGHKNMVIVTNAHTRHTVGSKQWSIRRAVVDGVWKLKGIDSLSTSVEVSSADNLGKQFGPRSGPTNRRA